MTTLEERIAEAARDWAEDRKGVPWPLTREGWAIEAADLARAVVAVLPTADVSDEAIWAALDTHGFDEDYPTWKCDCGFIVPSGPDEEPLMVAHCVAAVRALLDAQAAAHAAEVEALREQIDRDRIRGAEAVLNEQLRTSTAEADRDAYRARIDKLRAQCDERESDPTRGVMFNGHPFPAIFTTDELRDALDGDA